MTKMEAKGIEILSNKVSFENQINGYDIAQVDTYIEYITKAYQAAYDEYKVKCNEYDQLLESLKKLLKREQSRPSPEVISNTILKAEVVSEEIIADARAEAEKIITDARAKAEKIAADAFAEVVSKKIVADARAEAKKITADTCVETDKITADACAEADKIIADACNEADKIIADACNEAAKIRVRINNNVKQANVKIGRTARQMQPLLLPRVLDFQPGQKSGVLHLHHIAP